jgi:ABC-type uncharacterized transport system permease subunit
MRVLFAVTLGIVGCLFISFLVGENPFHVLNVLAVGAVGSKAAIGYTLFYATPLIFTGLSVATAFHCGLFNIGAEGQLYMGSLTLAILGILAPHLPMAPLFGIAAAFLGGALWGGIVGFLKAKRGNHEVIVTIMLNFIAYSVCSFAILHIFKNPFSQNTETAEIGKAYWLPGLGSVSAASPLNFAFIFALLVTFLFWLLIFKTTWGFEVRLLGSSPETAARSGVSVSKRLIQTMMVSGGFAGLVAVNEVMGFAHKFRDQYSAGYGFMGIAVALVGRNKPLGILCAALLFGALQKGSLELEFDTDRITRDLAGVMQALIILFVATESFWPKLFSRLIQKKVKAT